MAGALSLAALAPLHGSNPALYGRLTGQALPLVILAGVCGLAVLALLAIRRFTVVRSIAALGVAAVVWGWGVAQYPVLLPGTAVTLTSAGAPPATLDALVVLFVIAVLLIGPSFALLYILQGRRLLGGEPAPAASTVKPANATAQPSPSVPERPGFWAATLGALSALVIAAFIRRRRNR